MAVFAVSLLGIARASFGEHVAIVVLAGALKEMGDFYAGSVVALMKRAVSRPLAKLEIPCHAMSESRTTWSDRELPISLVIP
jgi:hypothetical protein